MKTEASRARGSAITIYLTVWALLAAAALAYLAMLVVRPEMMTRSIARAASDPEASRSLAKVAGELQALRQIASETKVDVAEIKSRIATQEERASTFADRMNAIEQRIATLPPGSGAQGKAAATQIVTGSLAPAAAAPAGAGAAQFGQIEVTRGAPLALQLASGASVEALRLTWTLLSERHRAQLKALEPRYVAGADGATYTLVAGPVASREEAQRLCGSFKARRVACTVADYAGEPL